MKMILNGKMLGEKTGSKSKLSVFTKDLITSEVAWGFVLGPVLCLFTGLVNKLRKEKSEISTIFDNAKQFRRLKITAICEELQRTSRFCRKLNIT